MLPCGDATTGNSMRQWPCSSHAMAWRRFPRNACGRHGPDRSQPAADSAGFLRLAEQAVAHDFHIGAHAREHGADGQAISHAEGMVGHHQQCTAARDGIETGAVIVKRQVQQAQGRLQRCSRLLAVVGPVGIVAAQLGLACQPFDAADDQLAPEAIIRGGIAEAHGGAILKIHGEHGKVLGVRHRIPRSVRGCFFQAAMTGA